MRKPAQFDLALVRPHPAATPPRRRNPELQGATRILRNRRLRLYRLVERTQATIAEIEDELRHRGVVLGGAPRHHKRSLPFRHNEIPRLCLAVLRDAGEAMHIREIAAAVLTAKGLDAADTALMGVTVQRVRRILVLHKRKGMVRLTGVQRTWTAKWSLAEG